jgi:hypothetical protein
MYQLGLVDGFDVDARTSKPDCVMCTEGKLTVKPFEKSAMQAKEIGQLTHIDLWGKYDVTSIHGRQYYILFVDDASRYTTVEFLKAKSQASDHVKAYLTYLQNRGRKPLAIRVDRGKEFINENLKSWCHQQGIEINQTAPYSPSQNGVAERMNRTLVELARTMRAATSLPEYLWEEATAHAAYLRNRSYTSAVKGATPYQKWHGKRPNVAHLREFGAPVWVLLQGQKVPRKMLPKSQRRSLVGFDDGSKSVLYYNPETRKVLTSRNYRFLNPPKSLSPPEEIEIHPDTLREGELGIGTQNAMTQGNRGSARENAARRTSDVTESEPYGDPSGPRNLKRKRNSAHEEEDENSPRRTQGKHIDYRHLHDPFSDDEDEDEVVNAIAAVSDEAFSIAANDGEPTLKEAKKSAEWPEWEKAIKTELAQLKKMGTWKLVPKPKNAIPIANKWVFAKKRNKAGHITKYKARLVAKGCSQRPGYDYTETHLPIVRLETIHLLLAIAAIRGLKIHQMDVKGAYLNGSLEERIYMRQPEGFEDGTDRICELLRSLYGLKQSGRAWNIEFDRVIRKHGFKRLRSDPCAYIRREGEGFAIITVWVDDLLLFATSDALMEKMKANINAEWETTDLGEPSKIIGIEITRFAHSISIGQKKYVEEILKHEGMDRANPVAMPLDPGISILPNPDGNEGSRSNSYTQLLGELQFLANATCPDISYAVSWLASYTANPSMQHMGMLKRILRYLKGTKDYAITYRARATRDPNLFHGFTDAGYANYDDLKSTSGYVFLAAGSAITWRSKKQSVVALSTTEVEYVVISEAGREACWLRNLCEEFGFPQDFPTALVGDNSGALAMAQNPQFHKRSKHIATKWHWICDMIQYGIVRAKSCHDPEQTADVLTKALHRPKHKQHTTEMGISSV